MSMRKTIAVFKQIPVLGWHLSIVLGTCSHELIVEQVLLFLTFFDFRGGEVLTKKKIGWIM